MTCRCIQMCSTCGVMAVLWSSSYGRSSRRCSAAGDGGESLLVNGIEEVGRTQMRVARIVARTFGSLGPFPQDLVKDRALGILQPPAENVHSDQAGQGFGTLTGGVDRQLRCRPRIQSVEE